MRAVPEVGEVSIAAPERCIKVFALAAVRNVKFHSSQRESVLSTAESAGLREDRQEQKTAREYRKRLQKMLISKFWLS